MVFNIFEFAVSFYINIVLFCQISKQFNSLFCAKPANSIESKPNHNTISDDNRKSKNYQRWNLFFKMRFLSQWTSTLKKEIKGTNDDSGKYILENSLLRGYIEGCDKSIKGIE